MAKRVFWVGVGVAAGIVVACKASAYVKAHTPKQAREFVLGPDQDNVALRTVQSLWSDFNAYRLQREDELNREFIERSRARQRRQG